MSESDYAMLQEQLSRKMKNNPYSHNGNYKREEGFREGILTAKSMLSDYYHRFCEKKEKE